MVADEARKHNFSNTMDIRICCIKIFPNNKNKNKTALELNVKAEGP